MEQPTSNRVYENHDPAHEWAHDEGSDTLILMLPGFRRDQMKIQVTSDRILKINGERQMGENKWRRFSKEFLLPYDADTDNISAKFVGGLLYVKLPKSNKPQEPTPQGVPKPQQQPKAEVPPTQKPFEDKTEAKADEISQKSKVEADANKAAEKREKANTEAEDFKETQEKGKSRNDFGEEAKATTSEAQEKLGTFGGLGQIGAKIDKRSPTRVLRLSSTQQYKEALVGLIVVVKQKSRFTNLILAILLVLVLGLYVKNAFKSYSGGARIQEL